MVLFSHFPIPACMCHTCLRYVTYYMCMYVFSIYYAILSCQQTIIHDIVNGRLEFQRLAKPYFMEPIINCQTFGSFPKSCSPKQCCQELRDCSDRLILSHRGCRIDFKPKPSPPPSTPPPWYPVLWCSGGGSHSQDLGFLRIWPPPRGLSEPFWTHIIRHEGPEIRPALTKTGRQMKEVLVPPNCPP